MKKPKPPKQKPSDKKSKFREESEAGKFSEKLRQEPLPPTSGQVDPKSKDGLKPLTKKEKAELKETKQLEKSKLRAEKSDSKLDKARESLADKKPYKKPGVVKTVRQIATAEIAMQAHRKVREVERENVGVEAAHNAELNAERVGRATIRHAKHRVRTRSERQVKKLEKQNVKRNADYQYRKTVKENPEMKKNLLKRQLHKKRIQRQYAEKARKTTHKAAVTTAAKAKATLKRVGIAIVRIVKNPKALLVIGILLLLIIILQMCASMGVSMFTTSGGGILATIYLSEDADMLAAESAYSAMEADLQYRLDNYETLNPGYDEYRYELDEIWHDPYALISILSAMHEGPWTIGQVQGMLSMLFGMQYTLTEEVTVEIRYRTETRTGTATEIRYDDDGEPYVHTYTYTYEVEVPYEYYIMTVTLENFNLSRLPIYVMSYEQLQRYSLYMRTLGNRPDLFPTGLFPHASTLRDYERYEIPPDALSDPIFAAMIREAEKYLGFPYVWGGSHPSTSFDCSGYVSWVINNTFWNVGRLGAKGLYNICTPVSPANARPGDLVFFWRTYRAPDPNAATHVGIYVGNGMMIHCGNPISYTSINTTYWQNHFFGFGRLPPP